MKKPTELPYFEGDFWPNVLEESIRELDIEEEERRASAAAEAAGTDETVWVCMFVVQVLMC